LFKLALATHLRKTLAEIDAMSGEEFGYWMAYSRYYQPLDNPWLQAGVVASASLLPYSRRGKTPQPSSFVPIEKAPQHRTQINATLARIKADLDKSRQ
jgi:hypothetical protein